MKDANSPRTLPSLLILQKYKCCAISLCYNSLTKMSQLQKIFRFSAQNLNGSTRYLYSINPFNNQGWNFNGLAFQTPTSSDPEASTINQLHFAQPEGWRFLYDFSTSSQGWTLDGPCFSAYRNQSQYSSPIFRYHQVLPDGGWNFFYSTSRTATSRLGSGWSLDGAVFFGYAGSVQ